MIVAVEIQETAFAATETQEQLVIVQDAELLHVGGGSSGCLF